jgi:hypothetical protein
MANFIKLIYHRCDGKCIQRKIFNIQFILSFIIVFFSSFNQNNVSFSLSVCTLYYSNPTSMSPFFSLHLVVTFVFYRFFTLCHIEAHSWFYRFSNLFFPQFNSIKIFLFLSKKNKYTLNI